MARKKISTTIYITQDQHDALKAISEQTRVPVAVYIREGIDLAINLHCHVVLNRSQEKP